MSDDVKVGVAGELDAWCTTCKQMKNHVVVAMKGEKPAKVECAGCHKQHVYRPNPPGTPKPKVKKVRSTIAAAAPPVDDLQNKLIAGEGLAGPYSPSVTYAVDQFLKHPTFGVGLVVALPGPQKIEVAFSDQRKVLVHQRGEAAPAGQLVRPKRGNDDDPGYVTDAPPPSKEGRE
jgi:hypothetical protein